VLDLPQELLSDTLRGKERPVRFGSEICKKAQIK